MLHKLKAVDRDQSAISLPDFATTGPICAKYVEILAKDRELQARRNEIKKEVAEIVARNPKGFGIAGEIVHPPRGPAKSAGPVEKLLSAFAPTKAVPQVGQRDADIERSRELSMEGDQLDDAMRVLSDRIAVLHRKASREYCERIVEEYRPLAANVANAVIALGEALEAHDEFTDELQRREIQWGYLLPVERPRWRDILRILKSAVEGGHLDARAIPEEWGSRA